MTRCSLLHYAFLALVVSVAAGCGGGETVQAQAEEDLAAGVRADDYAPSDEELAPGAPPLDVSESEIAFAGIRMGESLEAALHKLIEVGIGDPRTLNRLDEIKTYPIHEDMGNFARFLSPFGYERFYINDLSIPFEGGDETGIASCTVYISPGTFQVFAVLITPSLGVGERSNGKEQREFQSLVKKYGTPDQQEQPYGSFTALWVRGDTALVYGGSTVNTEILYLDLRMVNRSLEAHKAKERAKKDVSAEKAANASKLY